MLASPTSQNSSFTHLPSLSNFYKADMERFKKWLEQKRLSANTVKTYVEVTTFFIRCTILKNVKDLGSKKLIEAFNYDFIVKNNKSISYQNQCINGIKKHLDYKGIDIERLQLERPKKREKTTCCFKH